jgi:hypothetical protein
MGEDHCTSFAYITPRAIIYLILLFHCPTDHGSGLARLRPTVDGTPGSRSPTWSSTTEYRCEATTLLLGGHGGVAAMAKHLY